MDNIISHAQLDECVKSGIITAQQAEAMKMAVNSSGGGTP